MTDEEKEASRAKDRAAIRKHNLLIILSALAIFALPLLGLGLLRAAFCSYVETTRASDDDVKVAIVYLRQYANSIGKVRDMCDYWNLSRGDFPRVWITSCAGGPDAYEFRLRGDAIIISHRIWEKTGQGAVALKAITMFGEYQHTRLGGNMSDNQETQDELEHVRLLFPLADRTLEVMSVHHKNTENHHAR